MLPASEIRKTKQKKKAQNNVWVCSRDAKVAPWGIKTGCWFYFFCLASVYCIQNLKKNNISGTF